MKTRDRERGEFGEFAVSRTLNSQLSTPNIQRDAFRYLMLLSVAMVLLSNLARAEDTPGLTFHAAPKALAASAKVEDWPHFLGPNHNATSSETHLLKNWPKDGPAVVWEYEKGEGWACPAIANGRLVLFHRQNNQEVIDCLQCESGKRLWTLAYDATYQDRYGTGNGPRTSAVINEGRVYTFGISGKLHCLDLETGKQIWERDTQVDFDLKHNFFGHGSTPLAANGRLILNLGGKDNVCVVALDLATGKTLWTAKHEWGASYASPIPATIHGRECVLVFAGGESRPPTGGLLCIDAKTGQILNTTPHRPKLTDSVSASSPVVIGDRVFISESYGSGGELVEIEPDFSAKSAWKTDHFGTYFMTPVVKDGCLFGFDGQHGQTTELVCYEISNGKELWRDDVGGKFGKGSLLLADGGAIALSEHGDLAWLELSPKGNVVKQRVKLFSVPNAWTLPALSHGLLYVCQNDQSSEGKSPRLICYDLRGE